MGWVPCYVRKDVKVKAQCAHVMWPSINFVGLQVQLRGRRVCGLINFTLRSNANSQYSMVG